MLPGVKQALSLLFVVLICQAGPVRAEKQDPEFDLLSKECDAALKNHTPDLARLKAKVMISRRPASTKGYRQLARAEEELHNFKAALVAINRALDLDPKNLKCLLLRAKLYAENDQDNLARVDYRVAAEIEGQNADFYTSIALSQERLEDFEGALLSTRRALLIAPDDGNVQKMAGRILREVNRPAEAEGYLLTAIRLRGEDEDILTNLAHVHTALKKPAAVIDDINRATIKPDKRSLKLVEQYMLRAAAYKSLGRFAEARRDYDRSILISPLQRTLYKGRMEMSQKLGDTGAVEADRLKLKSLDRTIQPFNGF